MWTNVPVLTGKCEKFIKDNPKLRLSKVVFRKGSFVFCREHTHFKSEETHESADFRITAAKNEKGGEGWGVSYMRHTGKWQNLPVFGTLDNCFKEIKSGKWNVLDPY